METLFKKYNSEENSLLFFKKGIGNIKVYGYPLWELRINDSECKDFLPDLNIHKANLSLTIDGCVYESNINKEVEKNIRDNFISKQYCLNFPGTTIRNKFASTLITFLESIPSDLIVMCKKFPDSHWNLLKYATYDSRFSELVVSNPNVAYILANISSFNEKYSLTLTKNELSNLLSLKQIDIINIAGFEKTEKIRNIISKFDKDILSVQTLCNFKDNLSGKNQLRLLKLLSHLKRINQNVIKILSDEKYLDSVTNNFILSLSEYEKIPDKNIIKKLRICVFCKKSFNYDLPPINSVEHLKTVFAKLNNIYDINSNYNLLNKDFPDPPIKDAEFIKAIRNTKDMLIWGAYMQNCLKTLVMNAIRGKSYYYKVKFGSETATLELKKRKNEPRYIRLLGRRNSYCSNELRRAVNCWIKFKGDIDRFLVKNQEL